MKKLKVFLMLTILIFSANSYSQKTVNDSEWLYFKSDKPVQYSLHKTRTVGNKVYYKMSLKLDKNAASYCKHDLCYGYVIYFSIHQYDWETKKSSDTEFHFLLPKEYDGEYTINQEFYSTVQSEDDKFVSYWDNEKCYPMTKNKATGEISKLSFLYSCVDSKLKNREYNDYCNGKGFKSSNAIEIK